MKQVLGALTLPGPVVFPASSSSSSGMHVVCSCARFCGQVPHICTRQVRLRAHHVTVRSWITLKLGTPPSDGSASAYIGTGPSFKSTYTLTLTGGSAASGAPLSCNGAAAGTVVETYFASAVPANLGFRFFGTNQGGMIYQDRVPLLVTQSSAPAGAAPIQ